MGAGELKGSSKRHDVSSAIDLGDKMRWQLLWLHAREEGALELLYAVLWCHCIDIILPDRKADHRRLQHKLPVS